MISNRVFHDCGCVSIKNKDEIIMQKICQDHKFGKFIWVGLQHDKVKKEQEK
jgi:hypothetical protein